MNVVARPFSAAARFSSAVLPASVFFRLSRRLAFCSGVSGHHPFSRPISRYLSDRENCLVPYLRRFVSPIFRLTDSAWKHDLCPYLDSNAAAIHSYVRPSFIAHLWQQCRWPTSTFDMPAAESSFEFTYGLPHTQHVSCRSIWFRT